MRVLLSWLREFVPIDVEPSELAERMSTTGLTVDAMETLGAGISGVVIGEVMSVREHPNADNLMLVRARDGGGERDIVCGARNYTVGDRVPVARPGARLPNGMEIGERVVRGEPSQGMLCSARELGLSEDHSGIMILDRDAPLGAELVEALGLADTVFDVDVTPNRPDCLSVLGIAREIAAWYSLPFVAPDAALVESGGDVAGLARVRIDDARGCPRYLARVIEGVAIAPSPWWMRRRLLACGVRPISNVVDVTNYVMIERGQPLHAFDLDTLAGPEIVVRRPKRGESLETLDGQRRVLASQDVLICDAERPIALAGIMGGAETEVSERTTRILLESAYFEPLRIRPASRRLGLRTEASLRFERGTDPEGVGGAAARAAGLIASLGGGVVARGAIDAYPKPLRRKPVKVRVGRASALIGVEQSAPEMATSLRALGCDVEASKTALRVTAPSWRPDLEIEEDLIEEIARLYGYDRVPERLPSGARVGGLSDEQRARRRIREILLGAGLSEAYTLTLLAPTFPDRIGLPPKHPVRPSFFVGNPLSEEESALRSSLVPGLLLSAQRNATRRVLPVALFELGTIFRPNGDRPHETQAVAWVMAGDAAEGWHAPARALDFYDAKGVLETLLDGMGIARWRIEAPDPDDVTGLLHPARKASVFIDGDRAGVIGEIHPMVADELELPERVAVCTLEVGQLIAAARTGSARAVSRQPAVTRDIALIVPDVVPAAVVRESVRAAAGPLLESIEVFDVYRGVPVPDGHVSLAFSLVFRAPERTLTDAEADAAMAAVLAQASGAGWSVRD